MPDVLDVNVVCGDAVFCCCSNGVCLGDTFRAVKNLNDIFVTKKNILKKFHQNIEIRVLL